MTSRSATSNQFQVAQNTPGYERRSHKMPKITKKQKDKAADFTVGLPLVL